MRNLTQKCQGGFILEEDRLILLQRAQHGHHWWQPRAGKKSNSIYFLNQFGGPVNKCPARPARAYASLDDATAKREFVPFVKTGKQSKAYYVAEHGACSTIVPDKIVSC